MCENRYLLRKLLANHLLFFVLKLLCFFFFNHINYIWIVVEHDIDIMDPKIPLKDNLILMIDVYIYRINKK